MELLDAGGAAAVMAVNSVPDNELLAHLRQFGRVSQAWRLVVTYETPRAADNASRILHTIGGGNFQIPAHLLEADQAADFRANSLPSLYPIVASLMGTLDAGGAAAVMVVNSVPDNELLAHLRQFGGVSQAGRLVVTYETPRAADNASRILLHTIGEGNFQVSRHLARVNYSDQGMLDQDGDVVMNDLPVLDKDGDTVMHDVMEPDSGVGAITRIENDQNGGVDITFEILSEVSFCI